jgi:carbamoyl-phosphate synthase large subunit
MNILISGVGGPTPLGIGKSIRLSDRFKNARLIGIDGSPFAPGLYNKDLFDATYRVPHSNHAEYWTQIEKLVSKEKIDFAFIVPEVEVLQWSERLAADILPCAALIPDKRIAHVFYSKLDTAARLRHLGLTPRTVQIMQVDNGSELEALGYPFWVRAGSGAGAIGAMKINTQGELQTWLKINPRINDFLASEFLPGRNYACKVLCYQGQFIKAASSERIEYLLANAAPSGISGMCSRGKLLNNDKLVNDSVLALRTIFSSLNIQPHGMFTVDFKEDKEGIPRITEINIRHVSFNFAFALAGCNFVEDTLHLYSEGKANESAFVQFRFDEEMHFIRGVDSDLFVISNNDLKRTEH